MPYTDKLFLHVAVLSEKLARPLVEEFKVVSSDNYSLLLDSAGQDLRSNKHSIMLWQPDWVISHKSGRTLYHNIVNNSKKLSRIDPLDFASQMSQAISKRICLTDSAKECEHLPFQVGLAGIIGYDFARHLETFEQDKTLCETPDVVLGFYTKSIICCHTSNKHYLCYLSDKMAPDEVKQLLPSGDSKQQVSAFSLLEPWSSNMSEAGYTKALQRIKDYLVAGDCYQANFSQQFKATYEGDEYEAYLTLREHNKAPFSAFMRVPQGAILSVSPERFISVSNGTVETQPIKGTRPRSHDSAIDKENAKALLESEKDRAENLMIVDLLRNDISKHCQPNTVEVPDLFKLESFEAVHHMVSKIVGRLSSKSTPLDLIKDAFPGGSITGAPKVRAMQVIDELEPHDRNIYCGSVLYYGYRQDLDSSICIRTLLAENHMLYCCAGGGIVLDSQAKSEYQETLDKVAKILPVLANSAKSDRCHPEHHQAILQENEQVHE